MGKRISLPPDVAGLVEAARQAALDDGVELLLVGGSVRDLLLGETPHDLDFATDRDSVAVARTTADLLRGDVYVMDAERATARVIVERAGRTWVLDFALRRGATWQADLAARDVTLNAMALRPPADSASRAAELFDPLGGEADLAARRLRLASPHAIRDDAIRALRLARMAAQLDATLAPEAAEEARRAAPLLGTEAGPSAERMRDELFKTLALPRALQGMALLDAHGLLARVAPEAHGERGLASLRALEAVLAGLPELATLLAGTLTNTTRLALLRFAALLSGSVKAVLARARALRLSSEEVSRLRRMLEAGALTPALCEPRAEYAWMLRADLAAVEAALLGMSRQPGQGALGRALIERYHGHYAPGIAPPQLLTGQDLIALGAEPGPALGAALAGVREAQMIGEISTSAEALGLARRLLAKAPPAR
ncbi:MAG: hypothetical protein K1X39_04950 [Thermoflexales bacterium]|nr:hypothetical protein [Thermoflexales bacterium]